MSSADLRLELEVVLPVGGLIIAWRLFVASKSKTSIITKTPNSNPGRKETIMKQEADRQLFA